MKILTSFASNKSINQAIAAGTIIGIISNALGLIVYLALFSRLPLQESFHVIQTHNLIGKLISIGALLNLGIFFLFLKMNKLYHARGVLMATVFAAVLITMITLR